MKKTLVQVLQYRYSTYHQSYWGLGDLLKGIISVRQFCKKHNYNYVLDISRHKLSNFLKYSDQTYSHHISQVVPFLLSIAELQSLIDKSKSNVIFFNTNADYTEIDDETKQFIRTLLELKDEYMKSYIPISKPYTLLHYRLGDDHLLKKIVKNNYTDILSSITLNSECNTVLISDNERLRALNIPGIIIPEASEIAHIGDVNATIKGIKSSLIDMKIISESDKIKTYSVYPWVSGFVRIISVCYDIPLSTITL
jgi:hypothetical protein